MPTFCPCPALFVARGYGYGGVTRGRGTGGGGRGDGVRGRGRWNPLKGVTRSWGHFVRRSRSTQIRTLAMVGVVVVGLVTWVATSPSSTSQAVASTGGSPSGTTGSSPSPVSSASTSSRGVSAHAINVMFPLVSLNSLAGKEGFASDAEFGEQTKAILLFVKQINDSGGIHGRKINPDHHHLRPHQRGGHAGPVQDLDRGIAGRLRRPRRGGGLDRGQRVVHHPRRPHPLHRPVDHGDQLDQRGLAVSLVDGAGSVHHPPGRGGLGPQLRAPGRQEGGRGGRKPGLGPGGPQAVPAARPGGGRCDPGGRDHRRRSQRHRHHRHPGPPGRPTAPKRRGDIGHPVDAVQCLLPGAPGRDRPAVLPPPPAQ